MRAEEVSFVPFADDYERLYELQRNCDGEFGFVGSAYWGIPWLEAIMGCLVRRAPAKLAHAKPFLMSPDVAKELALDLNANAWLDTLLRFTRELVDFAAGRFPVCPPLLRGPGDAAAAMLGEMKYVTGFFDAPAGMRELLALCALNAAGGIRAFAGDHSRLENGIHAAGGYPSIVWSRRSVAYHQEDSAAVLNPSIFREFILPALRLGVSATEVHFIHLHSACLYPVYILLDDDSFDVIQINVRSSRHGAAGLRVDQHL